MLAIKKKITIKVNECFVVLLHSVRKLCSHDSLQRYQTCLHCASGMPSHFPLIPVSVISTIPFNAEKRHSAITHRHPDVESL